MASFIDRLRTLFSPEVRSPKVPPSGAGANSAGLGVLEPRRSARALRDFSERNPWVRMAINHRKRAITKARWKIVRIDDPKAKPDPKVVKEATALFNFVNDTRTNLSWLLGALVEDILVMDAGVFEKEFRNSGQIAALWPIPGEQIAPDPKWDGTQPDKPRYTQFINGKVVARYRNDELVYMMQNPRTMSAVGFSPLEALFETVQADLYGATMEYRLLRETAPAGILYMGGGVPPDAVASFRDQWQNDISAQRTVSFFGGGDSPLSSEKTTAPEWIPFRGTSKDEERRAYTKWLVTKIAGVFEVDMLVFNLSDTVTKSVGGTMTGKTDQGLLALSDTIESYLTREVLWIIDPMMHHGFEFIDITPRDVAAELEEEKSLMQMGATWPNEVRARRGMDDVPGSTGDLKHWANNPYPFQNNVKLDPEEDVIPSEPEPEPDPKPAEPNDED